MDSLQSKIAAEAVTAYVFLPAQYAPAEVAGVLPLVRLGRTLAALGIHDVVAICEGEGGLPVGSPGNWRAKKFSDCDLAEHKTPGAALLIRGDVFLLPEALQRFWQTAQHSGAATAALADAMSGPAPVGLHFLPAGSPLPAVDNVRDLFAILADGAEARAAVESHEWQELYGWGPRLAERKLSAAVGKQPTTWLGRMLAYPVSSRLARQFARMRFPVAAAQALAALALIVSAVLVLPFDAHLLLAGAVFVVAAFLDHAARDLALLTDRHSPRRQLAFTLVRYLGYGAFFAGLGINAYSASPGGPKFYVFAVMVSACLWGYLTLLMARFASREGGELAPILDAANLAQARRDGKRWWERALFSLDWLVRAESFPFLVFLFCALGYSGPLFWLSSAALMGAIISILRLLSGEAGETAKSISKSATSFLFYMVGLSILFVLVSRMPLGTVQEAIDSLGHGILWTIFLPLTWAVPYAMSLKILLNHRVQFRDALYTQVAGDAFNNIIPLMGLGGEPFKAKHLSNFVSLEDASRAIVQSRLVHALSGVLFTAVVMALTMALVEMDHRIAYAMGLVSALMLAATGAILWVTMSKVPSKATGFVLTKLKFTKEFRDEQMTWPQLGQTLALKLLGRGAKLFELYVLFWAIGISPQFGDVVLVEAMIMGSASLFFVVPQGLGVNEWGISTAFEMLGLGASAGLAYGLTRRTRVVAYSIIGLLVYLIGSLSKFGRSRYKTALAA